MDTSNSARNFVMEEENPLKGKHLRSTKSSASAAMTEALNDTEGVREPLRLASRVKDEGKQFLKHNQTCHWIQHMMTESQEPHNERKFRRQRILHNEKSNLNFETVEHIQMPQFTQPPVEAPMHYEEQLKLLQQQQQELLDKQRRLKEQFEIKMPQQELENEKIPDTFCCIQQRPDDDIRVDCKRNSVEEAPVCKPCTPNKRRLKGGVAQSCAVRDEGSIGSLIWPDTETAGAQFNSRKHREENFVKSPSKSPDNRYPRYQDTASSVSQALSYHTDSSAYTSTAKISDCSMTQSTEGLSPSRREEDKWSDGAKTPPLERREHFPCECGKACSNSDNSEK